ncbi:MAG: Small acid-soluble spore protein family [Paenibacillus sp.]|jgi:small acid-soluble spore protein P (minor)|nr:Small acid-soluble spore protein family [Paenibacillus sp.]
MSKPTTQPVNSPTEQRSRNQNNNNHAQQEPHSGSKKTKKANHTSHNNPQG